MGQNLINSPSALGLFRREPSGSLDLPGGAVPVFSKQDAYTENYCRIARDHIQHMARTGANPFIPEDIWQASEANTAALVRKYARPGARILDVGCGLGRLLEPLTDYKRYGMDISPDYLALAQGKGLEVCLARIEDMPYAERMFDLVVCSDVLEHVLDFDSACRHVLSVVRDMGVVVVRVPYRENLAPYRSPDAPYEFIHLRNFDEDGLALVFEKVHRCRVLEMVLGPYDLRYSRFKGSRLGGRGLSFSFRQLCRLARLLGSEAQRRCVEWAFEPFEVNVVIEVHRD